MAEYKYKGSSKVSWELCVMEKLCTEFQQFYNNSKCQKIHSFMNFLMYGMLKLAREKDVFHWSL